SEREAMYEPHLVEVVALGKGRGRRDPALRIARDGSQVLHVGREKEPAVVDPERVRRIREEAEFHPWAYLILVSRKRGVVVVDAHAGAELPLVRGRDRRLGVDSHVAPLQGGVRGGPGAPPVADRGEILVPAGVRREPPGL